MYLCRLLCLRGLGFAHTGPVCPQMVSKEDIDKAQKKFNGYFVSARSVLPDHKPELHACMCAHVRHLQCNASLLRTEIAPLRSRHLSRSCHVLVCGCLLARWIFAPMNERLLLCVTCETKHRHLLRTRPCFDACSVSFLQTEWKKRKNAVRASDLHACLLYWPCGCGGADSCWSHL
jgi:hypothetical protein